MAMQTKIMGAAEGTEEARQEASIVIRLDAKTVTTTPTKVGEESLGVTLASRGRRMEQSMQVKKLWRPSFAEGQLLIPSGCKA